MRLKYSHGCIIKMYKYLKCNYPFKEKKLLGF